jgi:hypothetical protein
MPGSVKLVDWKIESERWIRLLCSLVDDHAKGVSVGASCIGREDAAIRGYSDANWPLVVVCKIPVSMVLRPRPGLRWRLTVVDFFNRRSISAIVGAENRS